MIPSKVFSSESTQIQVAKFQPKNMSDVNFYHRRDNIKMMYTIRFNIYHRFTFSQFPTTQANCMRNTINEMATPVSIRPSHWELPKSKALEKFLTSDKKVFLKLNFSLALL